MKSYLGRRFLYPLILNLNTRWKWVVSFTPRPLYPAKERRYELNRRPCGFQSRFGRLTREIHKCGNVFCPCGDLKLVPSGRCPINIWTTIFLSLAHFRVTCPLLLCYLQTFSTVILSLLYEEEVSWEYRRFCYTRDTKTRYVEGASRTLWPRWKYLALWLSSRFSGCR